MKRVIYTIGLGVLLIGAAVFTLKDSGAPNDERSRNASPEKAAKVQTPVTPTPLSSPLMETTDIEAELENREHAMVVDEQVNFANLDDTAVHEQILLARLSIRLGPNQLRDLQTLRANPKVRYADGRLADGYEQKSNCTNGACVSVITNKSRGQVVWQDKWATGFIETGVGKEVVRAGRET